MQNINLEEFRHQLDLNVRFMDLDALHHVNNARYLNFLEEARIAYSQDVLGLFRDIKSLNVVVARIEIDYLKPITFGEEVKIYTRVLKMGNTSFDFECIICALNKKEEKIAARAIQTLVTFDAESKKSIAIPDEVREKIASYEPVL
ncbi:MAG: acyl-CoA thioesterase [Vicingaceae bacterium]